MPVLDTTKYLALKTQVDADVMASKAEVAQANVLLNNARVLYEAVSRQYEALLTAQQLLANIVPLAPAPVEEVVEVPAVFEPEPATAEPDAAL